jgi:hypothetical protein
LSSAEILYSKVKRSHLTERHIGGQLDDHMYKIACNDGYKR